MNRNDYHPQGGLHSEPIAKTSAVQFDPSQRRRMAYRALLIALLLGSLGAGALVDFGLRWFGLRGPPVFTLAWGIGAFVLISVVWARFELRAGAERAARRREDD